MICVYANNCFSFALLLHKRTNSTFYTLHYAFAVRSPHYVTSAQAQKWFGETSRRGMSAPSQASTASGQRLAKRQPGLGLIGLVSSPLMISGLRPLADADGTGIAESRDLV